MPPATASGASGAAAEAAGTLVEPFSMESFHDASGLPMHRMLVRVLPTADATLVRALAEHLAARPEFPPAPVWQALLARWVQLDAPAALAWARTVEGKDIAIFAFRVWAEVDLEAALAMMDSDALGELAIVIPKLAETEPLRALEKLKAFRGRGTNNPEDMDSFVAERLFMIVIGSWAALDPGPAAAYLSTNYRDSKGAWTKVAAVWALKDPDGCRGWLLTLPDSLRKDAFAGLCEAAENNPARVAEILRTIPVTDETKETFLKIAATWAEADAQAAQGWVRDIFPEGPMRHQALAQVARAVMGNDMGAALAIMDGIGWGRQSPSAQKQLLLPVQEEDPKVDFSIDATESSPVFRLDFTILAILGELGTTNPELALSYIEKTDPAGHVDILGRIVPRWFARQPEAATRWLDALPPDKLSAPDLTLLLDRFHDLEPEAARTWAQRLPPGPLQQALAGMSADEASLKNPAAAVEAIPFTDAASRHAALDPIIRHWSTTDPQAALNRLVREPTPLPETCEAVVNQWTLHDPTAASTWVAALAPGPNRDAAIKGLTTSLTDDDAQPDFPAALMWSLSMTDPPSRLKTAQSVLKNGTSSGPEAAEMRATLETTTALPESERRALLQLLKP